MGWGGGREDSHIEVMGMVIVPFRVKICGVVPPRVFESKMKMSNYDTFYGFKPKKFADRNNFSFGTACCTVLSCKPTVKSAVGSLKLREEWWKRRGDLLDGSPGLKWHESRRIQKDGNNFVSVFWYLMNQDSQIAGWCESERTCSAILSFVSAARSGLPFTREWIRQWRADTRTLWLMSVEEPCGTSPFTTGMELFVT